MDAEAASLTRDERQRLRRADQRMPALERRLRNAAKTRKYLEVSLAQAKDQRNAMYWVFCSGTCDPHFQAPLTPAILEWAEHNVKRMRRKLRSLQWKQRYTTDEQFRKHWFFAHQDNPFHPTIEPSPTTTEVLQEW